MHRGRLRRVAPRQQPRHHRGVGRMLLLAAAEQGGEVLTVSERMHVYGGAVPFPELERF